MHPLKSSLLISLSLLLYVLAGVALFAMLRALAVQDTLAAVESAFGSLVIGIFLLVLARRAFRAGREGLRRQEKRAP